MKKLLGFCAAAAFALSFTACNSSDTATSNEDSLKNANNTTGNTETNTASSVGNYAALADSVRINSEAGYYLNPKTGKAYKSLKLDSSGQMWDETGAPVWRYVDNRNWWVYGDWDHNMSWEQEGEAKMQNDEIMYKGDGETWVDYDTKWKEKDGKWKSEDGNIKIKTEKDGDTKIKVGDEKIKLDKDGMKKDD